ncbi:hypothetical protein AYJ54_43015 [Bradyrhizobium centrolobii]|uniref:Uncharacterized protein n=1 Tax=Bradyrhizobium centrolobii TaxID=1505087 RepID=A0A176Z121_9BRAD|nr:hypothetical protein AYJ54_43015 [Bradyrhizobium centrolobii]
MNGEGFVLLRKKLSCVSERDPAILRKKYAAEMGPILKEYFNASWVTSVDLGGVNTFVLWAGTSLLLRRSKLDPV